MFAQEFAESNAGFAACLTSMQEARARGTEIDFSEWGDSAEKLIELEPRALKALVEVYSDFHSQACKAGRKTAKEVGVRLGRPRKELPPNFEEEAVKWLEGKVSGAQAARNCGMPASSFLSKVRERQETADEGTSEFVDGVLRDWEAGKIKTREAAVKLGIRTKVFNRLVSERGRERQYVPEGFGRYLSLYKEGKLTVKEAAKLCGISVLHFYCCQKKVEEND